MIKGTKRVYKGIFYRKCLKKTKKVPFLEKKMVDRKKTDSFDEFEGLVKNVSIEKSDIKSDSRAVT
jgi:hypothetical protein